MAEEKKSRINPISLLLMILRRWWLIAIAIMICVVVVMLWSYSMPRLYSTATTVRVQQRQPALEGLSSYFMFEPNFMATEMEMVRSRRNTEKVVDLLKMGYFISESNPTELVDKIVFFKINANSTPGNYVLSFTDDRGSYRIVNANNQIVAKGVSNYRTDALGFQILIDNPNSSKDQYIKFHFNNYRNLVSMIMGSLSVQEIKGVDMVRVSINWGDPIMAAELANAVADAYVESSQEDKKIQSSSSRKFIKQQLDKAEENLLESERELEQYQRAHKVIDISTQAKDLVALASKLETDLMDNRILMNSLETQQKRLDEMLSSGKGELMGGIQNLGEDPTLSALYRNLYDLKFQRITMLETMTLDNPRVKALETQITEVQKQIDKIVGSILNTGSFAERLSLVKDQIRILTGIKNEVDARIRLLPEQQMTLTSLTRATQAYESIYTLLLTRYQEAKITEAMKTAEIQVVDKALVPFFPLSPHHGQNLMLGVLVGIILGLIATFLLEYLDTSIKNPDDVESVLEIPVLGTIGKFGEGNGGEEAYSRSCLLSHNNPKSPFAEAYRIIRTNIMLANVDKPPKTILMSSAMVGEGKTTTCVNLATVMAQTGEKVILVDTDLRRSHLHHVFRIGREPGVTNYLARNATIEEVINPTIVDNLYFVPSGYLPPNPSELLASRRMAEMIEALKASADVVIFDAPPVMVVTDAVILAKKLDGAIMVVHASITDRMLAHRAVRNLKDVGVFVLGGILNGFTASRSYSRYGYYYYRYYREGYY